MTTVDDDSDDEYVSSTYDNTAQNKPRATVFITGRENSALVDSGASLNLIDRASYEQWGSTPQLTQTKTRRLSYGSTTPIPLLGKFTAEIRHGDKSTTADFYVVKGRDCSLVSYEISLALGLISQFVHTLTSESSTEKIVQEFSEILADKTRIGCLNERKIKLSIDETIPGTVQPHRRIPFHFRKTSTAELKRLTALDVIEPVTNGATPWVSPNRVVPKPKQPGEIRITVDMRAPNKAIHSERHITPTIEDTIAKLSGSTVFSKVDLNAGG